MRPIPFHNRTRLFTLVIKPSPVAHNLPPRILYTVANNLGLSANRAFALRKYVSLFTCFLPSFTFSRVALLGCSTAYP